MSVKRLAGTGEVGSVRGVTAAHPARMWGGEPAARHERGAFRGAHRQKVGKCEAADGGTIFLDAIGDLHPALQAKLLHVLQDGEYSRVGGKSTRKVDVRVIAATNQDLDRAVAGGR